MSTYTDWPPGPGWTFNDCYGWSAPKTFFDCDPYMWNDAVEIDPMWLPGHEDETEFAKLNAAVLTLIHEEKRLPTAEEFRKIQSEALPPNTLYWKALDFNEWTTPAEDVTFSQFGQPVDWSGTSWEEFIKDEKMKVAGYHESALASVKGVTARNLNHPLI